jgi:hypothetical protein
MEIRTDIALTETESIFYKKFKNLSVNEEPKPQGDGVIRISPFDDYFIFTIYDEVDGVNKPIDLTNVGIIFMVFIGSNDEIRIPNFTNVENIDMAGGQVLFRIGKNDSRKILALNNRNFYISTMMVDPDGSSDESVIYTGTFLSFDESAKVSLSNELENARIDFSKQLASLQKTNDDLRIDIAKKNNLIAEQTAIIEALRQSNQNISNEIGVLTQTISSAVADGLLQEAKNAQKADDEAKKNRQQIASLQEVAESDQTKSKKKAFFDQAAKQLRSNIPGGSPVQTGGRGSGGNFLVDNADSPIFDANTLAIQ